jgi:hypothetical protein
MLQRALSFHNFLFIIAIEPLTQILNITTCHGLLDNLHERV